MAEVPTTIPPVTACGEHPSTSSGPEPVEGSRAARARLLDRMLARGWQFDFFQAVWLLERACQDRTPVGERGPVAAEPLRFRPDVSVGFPATDVRRITTWREPGATEPNFRMDVTFLGLYGVATPLPLHYAIGLLRHVDAVEQLPTDTAGAATEPRAPGTGSTPERDFLDILHHRLISLFYRSWTKYRYHVTFDMPHRDVITSYLLWLIGYQRGWERDLLGVSPLRMLRYAGTLTQHPRSAASLEGLLLDYWKDIPVQIEQFVGRWVALKPIDLNRIGVDNSRLGVDLTVGEQVYDISGAFNIKVGPMDWPTYVTFLPDGPRYAETRSIALLYSADPLSFSIEARLQAGQVPECQLASDAGTGRLGYTSWVRTTDLPGTSVTFDATRSSPARGAVQLTSKDG